MLNVESENGSYLLLYCVDPGRLVCRLVVSFFLAFISIVNRLNIYIKQRKALVVKLVDTKDLKSIHSGDNTNKINTNH